VAQVRSHPSTRPVLYCIHVRELPAQALLRLRPELHDKPCVVLEGEPSTETVCALNTRARLFGLRRGMTKVEVETFESVMVLQRSPIAETAVRAILLECAGAFSPRIEDRSASGLFVCVVDVAGTEGLFGPPLMLAKQMRQRIRSVGIVASVTISAKSIPEVGTVLVNEHGQTLYLLTSEKGGKITCTASNGCTQVWPETTLPSGTTAAKASANSMAARDPLPSKVA